MISPCQFFAFYGSLVVVSLSVAGVCATLGAWIVFPFAGLELLIVGILFLLHAIHATDYDRIELSVGQLFVEQSVGGEVRVFEFNALWAQVGLQKAVNPKIEVRYDGHSVLVGSHVPSHQRALIVGELRRCLRDAQRASLPNIANDHGANSRGK